MACVALVSYLSLYYCQLVIPLIMMVQANQLFRVC
jgi:hypothetical protein